MTRTTAQRALIASMLSITAAAWAQTPVSLGRADDADRRATWHWAKTDAPAPAMAAPHNASTQQRAPDDPMR